MKIIQITILLLLHAFTYGMESSFYAQYKSTDHSYYPNETKFINKDPYGLTPPFSQDSRSSLFVKDSPYDYDAAPQPCKLAPNPSLENMATVISTDIHGPRPLLDNSKLSIDPKYAYRTIDLENADSLKKLNDPEMQKFFQLYLAGNIERIELMRNCLDKELNHSGDAFDYSRFLDPFRGSKLRRLSFLNRILRHEKVQRIETVSGIQTTLKQGQKPRRFGFETNNSVLNASNTILPSILTEDKAAKTTVDLAPNDPHVVYDFKLTTPTDSDFLHLKITADPATDFHTYAQQVEQVITALKQRGEWTAETAILLTKGFAQGSAQSIVNAVHAVQHPIEFAQNFVQVNIEIIKQLGLLSQDLLSAPDDIFANQCELQQYHEIIQRRAASIACRYNTLRQIIPQISREQWGRIAGQLFFDNFMFKAAGKGLSIAKNAKVSAIFKENALLAKLHNSLEQTLLKHPEMVTAEGIAIKGAHNVEVAEQSLLLKMSSDAQKLQDGQRLANKIRITTKQAKEAAEKLGFKKTNYYSHGQPVFQKGNRFITIDVDSHSGGFWKMADSVENLSSKKTRLGTYDQFFKRIGD